MLSTFVSRSLQRPRTASCVAGSTDMTKLQVKAEAGTASTEECLELARLLANSTKLPVHCEKLLKACGQGPLSRASTMWRTWNSSEGHGQRTVFGEKGCSG